jgi:hypothetical protein
VVIFLETAELRAKNRYDITMKFWHENVDRLLTLNEKPLLKGKGTISNAVMEEKVREIYRLFDEKRKKYEAIQADQEDLAELKVLEEKIEQIMERYEKYKDSGVEWIGEIPERWEVRTLKYMALTMKQDKSFNPAHLSLFSPNAVVLFTDHVSDYI